MVRISEKKRKNPESSVFIGGERSQLKTTESVHKDFIFSQLIAFPKTVFLNFFFISNNFWITKSTVTSFGKQISKNIKYHVKFYIWFDSFWNISNREEILSLLYRKGVRYLNPKLTTYETYKQTIKPSYTPKDLCWDGLVGWLVGFLWHINLCGSFNARFCLYIHTYSIKDFKTNIKVGRIFYLQDFICLHKINQF